MLVVIFYFYIIILQMYDIVNFNLKAKHCVVLLNYRLL